MKSLAKLLATGVVGVLGWYFLANLPNGQSLYSPVFPTNARCVAAAQTLLRNYPTATFTDLSDNPNLHGDVCVQG